MEIKVIFPRSTKNEQKFSKCHLRLSDGENHSSYQFFPFEFSHHFRTLWKYFRWDHSLFYRHLMNIYNYFFLFEEIKELTFFCIPSTYVSSKMTSTSMRWPQKTVNSKSRLGSKIFFWTNRKFSFRLTRRPNKIQNWVFCTFSSFPLVSFFFTRVTSWFNVVFSTSTILVDRLPAPEMKFFSYPMKEKRIKNNLNKSSCQN